MVLPDHGTGRAQCFVGSVLHYIRDVSGRQMKRLDPEESEMPSTFSDLDHYIYLLLSLLSVYFLSILFMSVTFAVKQKKKSRWFWMLHNHQSHHNVHFTMTGTSPAQQEMTIKV